MAARPGEENVATLFGDIHYFYGPETDNPPHHRFDKGSYVYLFENAQARRTRIEVANRPGTALQDAFDGYLEHTSVRYTYRHSCMVSLTVHDVPNQEEWHLPTHDPQNQNIYHYKLRSLDMYFWTARDAVLFVSGVRRLLPDAQLDIEDEPAPPPPPQQHQQQHQQQAGVSSVVQKLESVALAEAVPTFAPPPVSAVSATPDSMSGTGTDVSTAGTAATAATTATTTSAPAFVPMAYNPAAPAAPETIRPREKTPPPEDDAGHHPLQQRLLQDASTPFSPGLVVPAGLGPLSPGLPPPTFQPPPGAPAFPGPPSYHYTPGVEGDAHPGHPGLVRAATMPASPFSAGFASPGFAPPTPMSSMAAPPLSHTPTPPPGSAQAIGGYSQYNYGHAGTAGGSVDYSVHQQLYRPTAGEATSHYKAKTEPRGRLEENAGRLERGVTGMLKRLEKKLG